MSGIDLSNTVYEIGWVNESVKDSLYIAKSVRITSLSFNLGVFSKSMIPKHMSLFSYPCELITDKSEMKRRDSLYDSDPETYGSYVFEIKVNNKKVYLDGTNIRYKYNEKSDSLKNRIPYALFLNHSCKNFNLKPQLIKDKHNRPHIVFYSVSDIQPDTELIFDYGINFCTYKHHSSLQFLDR